MSNYKNLYHRITNKRNFIILSLFFMCFYLVFANFHPLGSVNKSFISNKGIIKHGNFAKIHLKNNKEASFASFYADRVPFPVGGHYLFSNPTADSLLYLEKSIFPKRKITKPFEFRILYPYIVHSIEKIKTKLGLQKNISMLSAAKTFWWLNLMFLSLSVIILIKIFEHYKLDLTLKYIGATLFITQVAIIRTAPFPLIDIMTYFMFLTCFYLLIKQSYFQCAVMMILALLTKEVFIIFAPALIAKFIEDKKLENIYISFILIACFIIQRIVAGADILSMSINWNISQGEFHLRYFLMKFSSIGKAINYVIALIVAYGASLLYIMEIKTLKEHKIFYFSITLFTCLNFAIIFLSSTVTRNAALITPIFILLALLNIKKREKRIKYQ